MIQIKEEIILAEEILCILKSESESFVKMILSTSAQSSTHRLFIPPLPLSWRRVDIETKEIVQVDATFDGGHDYS